MECNYCATQFTHSTHTPRLLIFCGHSLCEQCCRQLHQNSRIQCPECFSNTFIEDINFLPKNLALLKVNSSSAETTCLKHEKKYEAFCEKQKMLLCVDCILQDGHRSHEMNSLKDSFLKESASLEASIKKIESLFAATKEKYELNLNNMKQSEENYHALEAAVLGYYQELRQMVQSEEQACLARLRDQFGCSHEKFVEKNSIFEDKIASISDCLTNLNHSSTFTEVEFLNNVTIREALVASISPQVDEPAKLLSLTHSKNQVADSLIKGLEKHFKTPVSTAASTQHRKQESSSAANSTKGTRKVNIQNQFSVPQPNSKSFSKKNGKKEMASSSIPAPVLSKHSSGPRTPQGMKEKNLNQPLEQHHKKQAPHYIGKGNAKQTIHSDCDVSMVEPKESLFNSFISNMTTFLTERKFIYVVGGFDEHNDSIIRMNMNSMAWEEVAKMSCPRSKFGCVAIDKELYLFGGKKGVERVADAEIWNEKNWKAGANLRKKRSGFGIANIGHLIYVIGGNDGESILNSVECLNTRTGEWKRKESMAEVRDELAVCVGKDDLIYAIGGFGGKNNEPLRSVQCFDPKTEKWKPMPSLNIERRALAAAALADGIYAIGGFDGSNYLNSVQKFEEGSHSWEMAAPLKKGRCTHSAVSVFDSQEIIVLGGFDQEALDSVERYSLITNEWEQICRMPSARFMHSCWLMSE